MGGSLNTRYCIRHCFVQIGHKTYNDEDTIKTHTENQCSVFLFLFGFLTDEEVRACCVSEAWKGVFIVYWRVKDVRPRYVWYSPSYAWGVGKYERWWFRDQIWRRNLRTCLWNWPTTLQEETLQSPYTTSNPRNGSVSTLLFFLSCAPIFLPFWMLYIWLGVWCVRFFKECPHPDDKQRMELSRELGLEPLQVKFWFQNKRTQMKVTTKSIQYFILNNNTFWSLLFISFHSLPSTFIF